MGRADCLLCVWLATAVLAAGGANPTAAEFSQAGLACTVTPAASGQQLVRCSLPLPKGLLAEGDTLAASDGHRKFPAAARVLTWHPAIAGEPKSARRALVTFPYTFKSQAPVRFALERETAAAPAAKPFLVNATADGQTLTLAYRDGPTVRARLLAPARLTHTAPRLELVESNAFFCWQRFHFPDPQWPRIIEIRSDALGGVVVVAHLQRNLTGDGRAPDFGWEIQTRAARARLRRDESQLVISSATVTHSFTNGSSCSLWFDNDRYRLGHPAAPLKRRGRVEVRSDDTGGLVYRYWRCAALERVPMQQAAWQRAEFVLAPAALAPITATLESPHQVQMDWQAWDALYAAGPPLDLKGQPELAAVLRYHHDAIVRSMALGDDWGNVTGYGDGSTSGGHFGMNRLNHCPPIFEQAWRSGDRRWREVALLWCDNFYDQSIWWGAGQTGGTRYNNIRAQNRTPPDDDPTYMWRSNDSVNFCTKGYDSFFLAYEETGDPRLRDALEAQVRYAAQHLHADRGECRNIGDARDFIRLYQFTGQTNYLAEALRLFRELRAKLSTGDLFDQGGKPLTADPPFIEEDNAGLRCGYAKPYIIGYALAGLPGLGRLAPNEPKLRDVIQAVADFLAESQDPIGGWRYPHPRSSYIIMSQGLEHAWQLVQADKYLGVQEKHLDAIERVLRQRILGWRKTGQAFSGLTGWEIATGKAKERAELYQLYQKPADRDFTRDYTEGRAEFGFSPPEGLVYFPEVLAFYLRHRPAERLLAPASEDQPLGKVLKRVAAGAK